MDGSSARVACDLELPGLLYLPPKYFVTRPFPWYFISRRALTTWDAISDLPSIPVGHDQLTIPYVDEPKSQVCVLCVDGGNDCCIVVFQMQRRFRAGVSELEDHITKPLNALQKMRLTLIPALPGADWRDLPNKKIELEDGRQTQRLFYPYRKEDGSKGVCSCATSTRMLCDHNDKVSFNKTCRMSDIYQLSLDTHLSRWKVTKT